MSYYGSDPNSSSTGNSNFYGSNATGYAAANNVQAWQTSQQEQQLHQQQQQQHQYDAQPQHQQQHQQHPNPQYHNQPAVGVWNPVNPATAAVMASVAGSMISGDNAAALNSISSYGNSFFQQGTAKMIPGLEASVITLRTYFAVDNRYVLRKIQKVLFPFLSKHWQRQIKQHAGPNFPTQYELPTVDENAPDLYLPSMTLITYVLVSAFLYGTAGQFNPEVIPDVTTKCFVTQILEVLAIRFGFYLMQAPVAILDLFSYTGYKYLGLCVNLVVGSIVSHVGFGKKGYYLCFCWTASAAAYFMLKTMANNIPIQTAAGGPKRDVMVLVFAASQLATMWFVSQTKLL